MFHALGLRAGDGRPRRSARRWSSAGASTPRRRSTASSDTRPPRWWSVPVMLQRMLDARRGRDRRSATRRTLRIIFVSGSALGVDLAQARDEGVRAGGLQPVRLDRDRLRDDRHARGPARRARHRRQGRARLGGQDPRRRRQRRCPRARPAGSSSATSSQFEGYTGGGTKEQIKGLMSSGDVGHFDDEGRLFIDGRDDEMIVSGGENVFPAEVEELLAGHEAIAEAAVIGVDDEKFGQRLKAFVVLRDGAKPDRGRGQGLRQGQPRPLQDPARGRVHRRAAAQPDRQGAQARAGRARARTRTEERARAAT